MCYLPNTKMMKDVSKYGMKMMMPMRVSGTGIKGRGN